MILQGAWIVALFLVLAGPGLPGGAVPWTGIGVVLFAVTAVMVPQPAWPYLGASLLAIAAANLARLHFRQRHASRDRGVFDIPQSDADAPIGSTATVTKAIRGGFGMVMIGNHSRLAQSEDDVSEGTRVQIVGANGEYLMVVRVD